MQHKILPETLKYFAFIQHSFFICFFLNILIHTCVHSDWLHIKITQKWCIENDKTPETAYLQWGHYRDYWKLFKVKIWRCFVPLLITSNKCYKLPFVFIANFELLYCFHITNNFIFLDLSLSFFNCTLIAANGWDFKGICTSARE